MKLPTPRKHAESELDRKIGFYKWLFGIGVLEMSTTVALFKYFKVDNEVLAFFYILGWLGLISSMWMEFQTVALMSTSRLFTQSRITKKKMQEGIKRIKQSMVKDLTRKMFVSIMSMESTITNLFQFGTAFLAIGILFPLISKHLIVSVFAFFLILLVMVVSIDKNAAQTAGFIKNTSP